VCVCVCALNVFVNISRNTEYELNECPINAGLKHLINDLMLIKQEKLLITVTMNEELTI